MCVWLYYLSIYNTDLHNYLRNEKYPNLSKEQGVKSLNDPQHFCKFYWAQECVCLSHTFCSRSGILLNATLSENLPLAVLGVIDLWINPRVDFVVTQVVDDPLQPNGVRVGVKELGALVHDACNEVAAKDSGLQGRRGDSELSLATSRYSFYVIDISDNSFDSLSTQSKKVCLNEIWMCK